MKIKGCPQIGCIGKGILKKIPESGEPADRWIVCNECHMTGPIYKSDECAIDAWNKLPRQKPKKQKWFTPSERLPLHKYTVLVEVTRVALPFCGLGYYDTQMRRWTVCAPHVLPFNVATDSVERWREWPYSNQNVG